MNVAQKHLSGQVTLESLNLPVLLDSGPIKN